MNRYSISFYKNDFLIFNIITKHYVLFKAIQLAEHEFHKHSGNRDYDLVDIEVLKKEPRPKR